MYKFLFSGGVILNPRYYLTQNVINVCRGATNYNGFSVSPHDNIDIEI